VLIAEFKFSVQKCTTMAQNWKIQDSRQSATTELKCILRTYLFDWRRWNM